VLDDLFAYRLGGDRYLLVTNSANHEADLAWLGRWSRGFDVSVRDVADRYAMLAVQGPHARAIVSRTLGIALPARMRVAIVRIGGRPALVCGTGYTGEDGVELLVAPARAASVWDAVCAAGAQPAGLGARDTLRLEACYHLYGNDLSEDRDPISAGLGWCCKEDTGFIGAEAISRVRAAGPAEKLAPFVITGQGIARQGNPVAGGGVVTSGTFSPCLGQGIGMAYLPAESAAPGTPIEIDVRGRSRTAEVRSRPLYSKES
jgi:aminomethyltransferase